MKPLVGRISEDKEETTQDKREEVEAPLYQSLAFNQSI